MASEVVADDALEAAEAEVEAELVAAEAVAAEESVDEVAAAVVGCDCAVA